MYISINGLAPEPIPRLNPWRGGSTTALSIDNSRKPRNGGTTKFFLEVVLPFSWLAAKFYFHCMSRSRYIQCPQSRTNSNFRTDVRIDVITGKLAKSLKSTSLMIATLKFTQCSLNLVQQSLSVISKYYKPKNLEKLVFRLFIQQFSLAGLKGGVNYRT